MKTNQIQFLLYAEKNKRETDKMNKLIKLISLIDFSIIHIEYDIIKEGL